MCFNKRWIKTADWNSNCCVYLTDQLQTEELHIVDAILVNWRGKCKLSAIYWFFVMHPRLVDQLWFVMSYFKFLIFDEKWNYGFKVKTLVSLNKNTYDVNHYFHLYRVCSSMIARIEWTDEKVILSNQREKWLNQKYFIQLVLCSRLWLYID